MLLIQIEKFNFVYWKKDSSELKHNKDIRFGEEKEAKQLIITKDMYFNTRKD